MSVLSIVRFLLICRAALAFRKVQDAKPEKLGVPCIASNCASVEPGSGFLHMATDERLCRLAFNFSQSCRDPWKQLLKELDGTCYAPRDSAESLERCESRNNMKLVRRLFNDTACVKEDLCGFAAAKLQALYVTCQSNAVRKMRLFDECKWVKSPDRDDLYKSLHCPCMTLNPEASRSGAVIQRTQDERYIVKSIKSTEMPRLVELLDYFVGRPLLNRWSYIDEGRNIVSMPNAFLPETYGLTSSLGFQTPPVESPSRVCGGSDGDPLLVDNDHGWDLKPLPIKSADRVPALSHLVKHELKLNEMSGWGELSAKLAETVGDLHGKKLVDYSLLLSIFATSTSATASCRPFIELNAAEPQCLVTPECQKGANTRPVLVPVRPHSGTSRHNRWRDEFDQRNDTERAVDDFVVGSPPREGLAIPPSFFSDPKRTAFSSRDVVESANVAQQAHATETWSGECHAVCVTVIDYLMKFTTSRKVENAFKDYRWSKYSSKVAKLWRCMGDITQVGCETYLKIACDDLYLTSNDIQSSWCEGVTGPIDDWHHVEDVDYVDDDDLDDDEDFRTDLVSEMMNADFFSAQR